jgi:peptide-methionine (S)-S-oxide reductase
VDRPGFESVHVTYPRRMSIFGRTTSRMVEPDAALPGRTTPVLPHPAPHAVLGTSLTGPWPEGTQGIYLAMGCFWGAEEIFWRLPGVVTTSVGYMGGFTPNPTYEEVCTGRTGQTETTFVAYDPSVISTYEILKAFWENHDPTQGYRQGNDVGTQYRSAVYVTTPEQRELVEATRDAYAAVIRERGYPEISTEVGSADDQAYYLAEDHHQQYLYKNPNGYRCHANTGLALPALV